MPREYRAITVHKSGRVDPEQTRIVCEAADCRNELLMADAYSVVALCWALTGAEVRFSSQCEEEQHFACSPACLRACLLECFDNHLLPLHQAKLDAHRVAAAQAATSEPSA